MAYAFTHFLDHADSFVTEHEAGHDLLLPVIRMEIGSADRGARDSHDRVGGRLETGVGNFLDTNVARTVEHRCFHCICLFRKGRSGAVASRRTR